MSVGFRIGAERPAVSKELVSRFSRIPVACISDSMHRMTAGGTRIRPIGKAKIAGPALAVKVAPGDNLMVHRAIAVAKPGDVLVVDAGGDLTNAILGERMLTVAHSKGIAGIIINGAIRDVDVLRSHDLPVYAAGVTHRGPYKNGPGELNYPIAIDGMVVESGDLIVADEDGFLCVPLRDVEAVCVAAEKTFEFESTTPPTSNYATDERLRLLGCELPPMVSSKP